jgi:hypothetical protein
MLFPPNYMHGHIFLSNKMRKDIEILLESEQADEERVNTKIFISRL